MPVLTDDFKSWEAASANVIILLVTVYIYVFDYIFLSISQVFSHIFLNNRFKDIFLATICILLLNVHFLPQNFIVFRSVHPGLPYPAQNDRRLAQTVAGTGMQEALSAVTG